MKKDRELDKILGLLNRLDEFYWFFFTGDFSPSEIKRMKVYIKMRRKWLFDWLEENHD